ncbi:MAG TPA: PE-PPE domain-containing protein [Nocardioidaceae bacterium]|nr:PE-PPE domain-containing protein [Nocardioidaceae bacterium]
MLKRLRRSSIALSAAALVSALGAVALSAGPAAADGPQYYVTVGGTCDGAGEVYEGIDLRGGTRLHVDYPAGAAGLCGDAPMDRSVEIGEANAKQVILDNWDPNATYTLVGYSQGAIVVNRVLEDIADGNVAVNKENFNAKLYADPMAPVGPPGVGIGTAVPKGWGVPSPFGGYVSPGKGRTDFNGIEYVRYCIETDGVCDFLDIQGPGGYFAQHRCYRWTDPNGNDLMADTLADGYFNNGSVSIPKKDCRPPWPTV